MRVAVLSLLLLTACNGYDDLRLLEIEVVEPSEIEPGTTVRIHGQGFALGRTPTVELRGEIYRPGAAVTSIGARLEGRVRSESLIEVPVGADLIDALGGRASIDGEVRVGFRAADGHRDVYASERVRLDVLPDTAAQLRVEGMSEPRDVDEPGQGFGITLSREELGVVGVRVEAVEPRSLAARQGVRAGDTILALDRVNIYGWRDFIPNPSRTESTVLVARDGLRGVHVLRWPHEATVRKVEPLSLAVFVVVGLLIGWCSPIVLAVRRGFLSVAPRAWLVRAALVLLSSALIVLVPALQWTTMWILVLGTLAALFALVSRQRAVTASFALVVCATLTVMLLAKTASIVELVGIQGPQSLRWYLFQTPASSLAFLAFLSGLGILAPSSRLPASLYVAPAAALGAVLFLAGWPAGGSLIGVVVLAAKAGFLLLAAHFLQARLATSAALCAGGLALGVLGLLIDLDAYFPQWSALAVGASCAVAARALVPPWRQISPAVPA